MNLNMTLWEKFYEEAKKYYIKHGNLFVPIGYKVKIDEHIVDLGRWVYIQRQAYNKKISVRLTEGQICLLNEIGMIWEIENSFQPTEEQKKKLEEIAMSWTQQVEEKKTENTDITEENKKKLEEIGLCYVSKEESKTNNIVFTDADNNINNVKSK